MAAVLAGAATVAATVLAGAATVAALAAAAAEADVAAGVRLSFTSRKKARSWSYVQGESRLADQHHETDGFASD